MDINKLKKGCLIVFLCYVLIAILFYWIAGEQLHYQAVATSEVGASAAVGEITKDVVLKQGFVPEADELNGISFLISTYERVNTSNINIRIVDESGTTISSNDIQTSTLNDNSFVYLTFDAPISLKKGTKYDIIISSNDGTIGNAVTFWMGNAMSVPRGQIALDMNSVEPLYINGESSNNVLVFQLQMRNQLSFGQYYWYYVLIVGLLLAAYLLLLVYKQRKGESFWGIRLINVFKRYRFLMKQLITRDFKTRYKRSVLGVLWSFLTPLLTMSVQYLVFSTLFKSNIPNFAMYLLAGIVCYSFFNESTNLSLTSITGNATLITKVYMPKYIYPLSRVLSSSINLLFSLIPLIIVMVISRLPITKSILLLPFGVICLIAFCTGMGFLLSTLMVFFRDTQFLWNIVGMLWMYATPIFYPESIIPQKLMPLFKCNPLYHIIRFMRSIFIEGVSPAPKAYLFCIIASFVPLLIGTLVFKKNQDKFVLNL